LFLQHGLKKYFGFPSAYYYVLFEDPDGIRLVVQLKQMIPALPFSSPPRKRGSRAASLVPAGLEPALLRP
jgi:hypothetical protein